MRFLLTRLAFLILAIGIAPIAIFAQGGGSTGGGGGGSGTVSSGGPLATQLSAEFCGIVNDIRDVVGIFALAMFLIGAILYAGGNFMPTAGNLKSSTQGWAMGMIIGGVIGIVLVLIAPFILSTIISFSSGSIPNATC